jgi:hypothetical protein
MAISHHLAGRFHRWVALSIGILAVAVSNHGWTQTKMCIPPPGSVAYLSGPPRWWDQEDQNNHLIPSYDTTDPQWDPRWIGARADGYGGGTTNDAWYRALFNVENGTTYLYMSWFVNVAPTFSAQNTSLYIGLSPATQSNGGPATVIQATLNSDTENVPGASSDGAQANMSPLNSGKANGGKWSTILYQSNGQNGWTTQTPAWFTDTTNPLSFVNTADAWANPQNNHQWAVNLRIPLDPAGVNGINLGSTSNFNIWFYIQPDLTVVGNQIGYIPYTWPRTTSDVTTYIATEGINGIQFPAPNTWGPAALESASADTTCKNGVDLEDDQIGTTNTPASYINPWGVNTFFAAPSNYGPAVAPNVINARFRMANWGAQVGDLTSTSWTDIPNLSSVADTIGMAAGSSSSPTSGNINGQVDFTSSDPAIQAIHCAIVGQSGIPTANPPVKGDPSCANANPTQEPHQCILVSLTGSNVDFIRDLAFHNMDFTQMDFSEQAEISIKGLPPLAAGRDVYLFIETRNMPAFPSLGYGTPPAPSGRVSLTGASGGQASIFNAAAQTMPTYIVHAYYDTGKTVTIRRVTHPLYQPLTSYGYFVQHKGLSFGWQPTIEGATQVSPGFYKLTIPNNGAVKVNSTINAIDLTTWWIWLILLVLIVILILIGWLIGGLVRQLASV